MSSPYVDPRTQKYSPGNQNKGQSKFPVNFVTTVNTGAETNAHIIPLKAAPLSGMGKVRDQRKIQNPGFSL